MIFEISIAIPTKDREKDLLKCVESVKDQTLLPLEVLIIDDGKISELTKSSIQKLLSEKQISFRYFKKNKPSLAESKNLGAKRANGNIILFLDDDVVLERDYLERLLEVWEKNKEDKKLAGVSGMVTNVKEKYLIEKIFNRIFFLYSLRPWSILPWGFQTHDYNLRKEEKTEWTPCGFTSFRKEIFDQCQFKPLQSGRTALEDIEFCWRLKKDGYYFIITPFAKLIHNESQTGREEAMISGYKEGFNRCLIFKTHTQKTFKNYLCFLIATLGWIIRQWLAIFIEPRLALNHFFYSVGLIKGNFCFLIKYLCKKRPF
ncbi:hypothetical protein AMJ49_04220 [Parcubacteria bacterium DG_74_2]|nr:MAG: hypothetical protein AMJ49_04220 [Parcubacteria bacterium DG_74_2]